MLKYTIEINYLPKEFSMKRLISLILCILMVVPFFAFSVFAEGEEELNTKRHNFALFGSSYATSKWNNDSDPKYINNDTLVHSYQFWRPDGYGRDPSFNEQEQLCGIRYQNGKYYEVQEVVIYNHKYDSKPFQDHGLTLTNNIKYTVEALVLGEWIVIGEARNNDDCNQYLMKDIKDDKGNVTGQEIVKSQDNGHNIGVMTIDVIDTVTKHIRIRTTDWGRYADGTTEDRDIVIDEAGQVHYPASYHNWWNVPIIHEVQTWGVEAPAPAWDVPEGAELSTNACLSGFADATSSDEIFGFYPARVNDNALATTIAGAPSYWRAGKKGAQTVTCKFDQAYDISTVALNFGNSEDGVEITYTIQLQKPDGTWVDVVVDAKATTSALAADSISTNLSPKFRATAMKVMITESTGKAIITEMYAYISPDNVSDKGVAMDKCVYLKDYITENKKQSAAVGNLAWFGTAYASSTMTYANMSSIEYINDGKIATNEDFSWFAKTFEQGTYCGVVLPQKNKVDKVVLYFNDKITGSVKGDCVMSVDIQVKQADGTFKTVKTGVTSYDQKNKEYIVSASFEAVETDDVRVVYQSNGSVFPYIKELEVYSSEYVYGAFQGYDYGQRTWGGKEALADGDFAYRTISRRSRYLDLISPIQQFIID